MLHVELSRGELRAAVLLHRFAGLPEAPREPQGASWLEGQRQQQQPSSLAPQAWVQNTPYPQLPCVYLPRPGSPLLPSLFAMSKPRPSALAT